MTTPGDGRDGERVDLGKNDGGEADFDPYRFGRPEQPVSPEYAPPGYTPPPASPPPGNYPPPPAYGQQGQYGQNAPQGQWGQPPQPPGQYSSYGQPPAPYGRAPQQGSGKATTALVLGILSVVLFWLTFVDLVLIIPALIFGFIALSESKRRGGAGRGKAIAGLICAAVAVLLAVALLVFVVNAAEDCGGVGRSGTPGFNECLRDNL